MRADASSTVNPIHVAKERPVKCRGQIYPPVRYLEYVAALLAVVVHVGRLGLALLRIRLERHAAKKRSNTAGLI
jgi:hypothetical protein